MPRGYSPEKVWSDEDFALAERRWKAGWSAGQIAKEIGRTRNAVLGMADRNRDQFPKRAKVGGRKATGPATRDPASVPGAWTPEIILVATEMWANGASANEIGAAIGKSGQAVAIRARAYRKQFPARPGITTLPKPGTEGVKVAPPPKPTLSERFSAEPPPLDSRPVTLLKRGANQCCWPLWEHYGDRPTTKSLYCGGMVEGKGSYCAHHREKRLRRNYSVDAPSTRRAA